MGLLDWGHGGFFKLFLSIRVLVVYLHEFL